MFAFSVVSTCGSSEYQHFHYHTHTDAEIIYVKSGEIVFYAGEKEYYGKEGDLFIVGRLERHATKIIKEPYTRYCITINSDLKSDQKELLPLTGLLQNAFHKRGHRVQLGESQQKIEALLLEIIHECNANADYVDEINAALLYQLLILILRLLPDIAHPNHNKMQQQILQIQQMLDTNFTEQISIQQIAKENCVSEDYLMHLFKDITGYSLRQYINVNRLVYARELLKTTPDPVYMVAYKCGFTTTNHFIRSFRKYYGESPGAFKKNADDFTMLSTPE